jgi:hypothetical protein
VFSSPQDGIKQGRVDGANLDEVRGMDELRKKEVDFSNSNYVEKLDGVLVGGRGSQETGEQQRQSVGGSQPGIEMGT